MTRSLPVEPGGPRWNLFDQNKHVEPGSSERSVGSRSTERVLFSRSKWDFLKHFSMCLRSCAVEAKDASTSERQNSSNHAYSERDSEVLRVRAGQVLTSRRHVM